MGKAIVERIVAPGAGGVAGRATSTDARKARQRIRKRVERVLGKLKSLEVRRRKVAGAKAGYQVVAMDKNDIKWTAAGGHLPTVHRQEDWLVGVEELLDWGDHRVWAGPNGARPAGLGKKISSARGVVPQRTIGSREWTRRRLKQSAPSLEAVEEGAGVIQVVGSSKLWWDMEERLGLCHLCSGDGELAETDRACYHPELYPEECSPCPDCNGTGKSGKLAESGFTLEELEAWVQELAAKRKAEGRPRGRNRHPSTLFQEHAGCCGDGLDLVAYMEKRWKELHPEEELDERDPYAQGTTAWLDKKAKEKKEREKRRRALLKQKSAPKKLAASLEVEGGPGSTMPYMPDPKDPRREWVHVGGDLEASYDGAKYVDLRTFDGQSVVFASRGTLLNAVDLIVKPISEALTAPQMAIWDHLSPAARRLLNDLARSHGKYHGQESTTAAKTELMRMGLVRWDWGAGNPRLDRPAYTRQGKSMISRLQRLRGWGGLSFEGVDENVQVTPGDVLRYAPYGDGGGFVLTDAEGTDHFFLPREEGMFYDGWGREVSDEEATRLTEAHGDLKVLGWGKFDREDNLPSVRTFDPETLVRGTWAEWQQLKCMDKALDAARARLTEDPEAYADHPQPGEFELTKMMELNREVLARRGFPLAEGTIKLDVTGDEGGLRKMLAYIAKIASHGHSFPVVVDPDDREYRKEFGIDGDGAFRLKVEGAPGAGLGEKRTDRDYTKERLAEPASRRKDRAGRNLARARLMRGGRVKKGDGNHVHHRDGNPQNSAGRNLGVQKAGSHISTHNRARAEALEVVNSPQVGAPQAKVPSPRPVAQVEVVGAIKGAASRLWKFLNKPIELGKGGKRPKPKPRPQAKPKPKPAAKPKPKPAAKRPTARKPAQQRPKARVQLPKPKPVPLKPAANQPKPKARPKPRPAPKKPTPAPTKPTGTEDKPKPKRRRRPTKAQRAAKAAGQAAASGGRSGVGLRASLELEGAPGAQLEESYNTQELRGALQRVIDNPLDEGALKKLLELAHAGGLRVLWPDPLLGPDYPVELVSAAGGMVTTKNRDGKIARTRLPTKGWGALTVTR